MRFTANLIRPNYAGNVPNRSRFNIRLPNALTICIVPVAVAVRLVAIPSEQTLPFQIPC